MYQSFQEYVFCGGGGSSANDLMCEGQTLDQNNWWKFTSDVSEEEEEENVTTEGHQH
jgi:hypothetical protein